MNDPLKDWDKLQSEWQAYEPDIQKIKKKINWVTWRMYFILAMDVLILVSYFPFVYYMAYDFEAGFWANSWHYFMGVFLAYGVYLDFKIRLPILRNSAKSTKEVLSLFIERVNAGVYLGWVGKIFCYVMILFFWIWVGANAYLEEGDSKVGNLGFFIFGTVWIASLSLIFIWYERKKRKELKELKSLWKDYLD